MAPVALAVAIAGLGAVGCVATSAGDRLLEAGRAEEAAVAYAQVGGGGDDAALHQKLGLAFLGAGLPAAAEREWLRAKELAPTDPTPVFWLGLLASESGDTTAARLHWIDYARLATLGAAEIAPSAAAGGLTGSWGRFRLVETEAVVHPERARGRQLLYSLAGRLDPPGLAEGERGDWDPRVADADIWVLGTVGLPEFPPPPGRNR